MFVGMNWELYQSIIALVVDVDFSVHRGDQILFTGEGEVALLIGGALREEVVRCNWKKMWMMWMI
jgi:hypothetical protein